MNDKLHALLSVGSGRRTYIVAALLVLQALVPLFTGQLDASDVDLRALLEGLGLATLRAGMK